jgi:hypothetical protein
VKQRTRSRVNGARVNHALGEIYIGSAARESAPTIVERDDLATEIERRRPGKMRGRVYLVWTEHLADGACDRNPVTDPHEDLGYVGKTIRDLAVRWLEHLMRAKADGETGEKKPNNSAVYRHRAKVTGFSADPRVYGSAEDLARAETRAIKTLWPAWNIQDQDRRNPHTRASRAYRKPDRLAPLIGLASVLWGLVWAAMTGGLLWVVITGYASAARATPWYWLLAAPLIALYIVNGTALRHARRIARRRRSR